MYCQMEALMIGGNWCSVLLIGPRHYEASIKWAHVQSFPGVLARLGNTRIIGLT